MPSDVEDIKIAKRFFEHKSVNARPYEKRCEGKKVDLILFYQGEKIALCEVKAIREEILLPGPLGRYGIEGRPSVFNKVEKKIHTASNQFLACNPDHAIENIILFINYDQHCSETDLRWLLMDLSGGNQLNRLINGDFLSNIDLMIWINEKKRTVYPLPPDPGRSPKPPNNILQYLFGNQGEQLPEDIFTP